MYWRQISGCFKGARDLMEVSAEHWYQWQMVGGAWLRQFFSERNVKLPLSSLVRDSGALITVHSETIVIDCTHIVSLFPVIFCDVEDHEVNARSQSNFIKSILPNFPSTFSFHAFTPTPPRFSWPTSYARDNLQHPITRLEWRKEQGFLREAHTSTVRTNSTQTAPEVTINPWLLELWDSCSTGGTLVGEVLAQKLISP